MPVLRHFTNSELSADLPGHIRPNFFFPWGDERSLRARTILCSQPESGSLSHGRVRHARKTRIPSIL